MIDVPDISLCPRRSPKVSHVSCPPLFFFISALSLLIHSGGSCRFRGHAHFRFDNDSIPFFAPTPTSRNSRFTYSVIIHHLSNLHIDDTTGSIRRREKQSGRGSISLHDHNKLFDLGLDDSIFLIPSI